jgi:penicillin-binding protein 2
MFRKFFNKNKEKNGMEIEDSIMTVTQKEEALIEFPFARKNLVVIWYAIVLAILILAGRVFYLDFFQGSYYEEISKNNRIRSIVSKAPRGLIIDKHGKILAKNIPSLDVIVVPGDLPESEEERKKMAKNLADILGMDLGNAEIILMSQNTKSFNPIFLKENISYEQALVISGKISEFPGISLEKTAIRSYENGIIFSHIIGYDGKITKEELNNNQNYLMTDYIGKTGLEKRYEKELRGKYGAERVEIDSMGNIKKKLGTIIPTSGSDLILNIDEALQKKLYDSLTGILVKTDTASAAAVAIDPRNGGILAMASLPSFDNNLFARGITNEEYKILSSDKNLPFLNRAVAGEYPPGSTIKPIVAAAALTEKIIDTGTALNCPGAISIGKWVFHDWKTHGTVDVKKAIAESCDIFFYSLGGGYGNISGLGMTRMKKYENLFGLGDFIGIDLPGESSGFIPDEKWKETELKEKWYIGDNYHAAIGQGFITATPLQLANYVAAVANGGTLYSPRVVNRIKNADGMEEYTGPKIIRKNFISQDILKIIQEGMRQTVTEGSASSLNTLSVAIAGKTGTAQFGAQNKTHAWFVSFAPYDDPQIAMAVLVEGGGEGSSLAVPVTKEVYDWYFKEKK